MPAKPKDTVENVQQEFRAYVRRQHMLRCTQSLFGSLAEQQPDGEKEFQGARHKLTVRLARAMNGGTMSIDSPRNRDAVDSIKSIEAEETQFFSGTLSARGLHRRYTPAIVPPHTQR